MEMFLLNAKEKVQKKELPMEKNQVVGYLSSQVISNLALYIFQGSSTSVLHEENSECKVYTRGLPHKPEMVVRDERYGVCP